MAGAIDKNQKGIIKEAVRQFVDAQLRGEELDTDEFVKKYPGLDSKIREGIQELQKIDALFDSLVQADESDFADTATGHDLAGQKIGAFEIIEMIGKGGMGVVYLARDTRLKRSVAVKSIPAALTGDSTARMRFRREAELLASLNHPNIGVIHEIIEEEKSGYLILEYVPGDTLTQRIAAEPLKLEEALSIGRQVAEAVSTAHEKGVIHRDLKPGNIKITPDGRVKVLDFGLAKTAASKGRSGETTETQPGHIIGTPAYMSPEQARGKDTDQRTDIWSFGCIMFQMMTGHLPFEGETATDTLAHIIEREPDWGLLPETTPTNILDLLHRCLEKDPARRYQSGAELLADLQAYAAALTASAMPPTSLRAVLRLLRRPRVGIPTAAVVIVLSVMGVWLSHRSAKVRWAKVEALPEVRRLIEQDEFMRAFELARQAERYIPDDAALAELWPQMSRTMSVKTTPPGVQIFFKHYSDVEGDWIYLGRSPVENVRFPRGHYRWRATKEGFETAESMRQAPREMPVTLQELNAPTSGMVHMYAQNLGARLAYFGYYSGGLVVTAPAFWIDRHEVTNAQFKEFLDCGGYEKQEYWKHAFVKDGEELPWKDAMGEFRDQTGRPGPSTWEGGTYPEGNDQYPVSGVSWYEAAAYAEFAGKNLPTIYHWSTAARTREAIFIIPFSNCDGSDLLPVGAAKGMGVTGLYDMAGNAKEWCHNAVAESEDQRYILGGAWSEPDYMFLHADSRSAWDRYEANGFRCVKYIGGMESVPQSLFEPTKSSFRDYTAFEPISDEVFQVVRDGMYSYDQTSPNGTVDDVDDNSAYWLRERVTFDAAYGGERVVADLFLPKEVDPPYQTIIYFSGSSAIRKGPDNLDRYVYPHLVKNGRACMYPHYKGTHARRTERTSDIPDDSDSYRQWVIQMAKDLQRSIDYLETRDDINIEKLAYLGISWGGELGPIMLAVEDRLKVGVLVLGGPHGHPKPAEVEEFNFARHVTVPVLMINGKHDTAFPVELAQKPFFEALGTPQEDKQHTLYLGGHDILRHRSRQIGQDTVLWLDRYLGPVE
jgi:serine/threonine protein kinase/dienelactone hydrolase